MTEILKLAAAAVILVVLYTALKTAAPAYAPVLALAGAGAVLVLLGSTSGARVLEWLQTLQQAEGAEAFGCLFKAAGILLVTDYTRSLCRDAGLSSAGVCMEFAGRCLVLMTAWPILEGVFQAIERLST
ncbi:MAG: stage III sporulation protein AD [Faecalibacterium sp.]|jgi:stage III sporulation protein AD|nr:stage III sporulation protein AD [Faecalibacterium sp.]